MAKFLCFLASPLAPTRTTMPNRRAAWSYAHDQVIRCVFVAFFAVVSGMQRVAAFCHLVIGVCFVRAYEQVRWIAAGRVIATVTNNMFVWNCAAKKQVAQSMSEDVVAIEYNPPVSSRILERVPIPAASRRVDVDALDDSILRRGLVKNFLDGLKRLSLAPLYVMGLAETRNHGDYRAATIGKSAQHSYNLAWPS